MTSEAKAKALAWIQTLAPEITAIEWDKLPRVRVPKPNKPKEDYAFYIAHSNRPANITFIRYDDQNTPHKWQDTISPDVPLTDTERATNKRQEEEAKRARNAAAIVMQAEAASKAKYIYDKCTVSCTSHPYLTQKCIHPIKGLKISTDPQKYPALIVPVTDTLGKLYGLQFISTDGERKHFLTGTNTKGHFFPIGGNNPEKPLFICEGVADGISINASTEFDGRAALGAGNLLDVALVSRKEYPNRKIIICADNDIGHSSGGNPGVEYATKAARAINARLAIPEMNGKKVDFNDLYKELRAAEVRRQVEAAIIPEADTPPKKKADIPSPAIDDINADNTPAPHEDDCAPPDDYDRWENLLPAPRTDKPTQQPEEEKDHKNVINNNPDTTTTPAPDPLKQSQGTGTPEISEGKQESTTDKPTLPALTAPLKHRQLGEGHAGLVVMSPDPAPVDFGEVELPAIDTSWLPPTLKAFVDAASESLQVPPEMPACNALCATAIAMQAKIRVRINSDWLESLNLYVMAALPPGERKSATVELCKAPIVEWERRQAVELGDEIKRVKSDRKNLEKEIDLKRAKLGKATDANRQAMYDDILNLEKKMPELLYTPRHLIDDVTPEGLAAFMDRHDDSAGAMQAEGGIIDAISGRYSKKPNLNIFLKAWDGESITVDRRQGDCFALEKPYLTLCVTAQPGVITELGITKGFKSFGLLDRFLYVVPKSWLGIRNQNPQGMSDSVKMKYTARIKAILDIQPQRDESGKIIQHELRLSEQAQERHNAFRTGVEPELRENGELGAINGWGAKLPGHAARIAGLLHPWTSDTWQNEEISDDTMDNAIRIAALLTAHARRAFELMEIDQNIECAKRILDWIKRNGKTTFTARDCWHGVKGRYKRMEVVTAGLEILQQRFFIFNETPAQRPSHRPSVTYRTNKSLFVGA